MVAAEAGVIRALPLRSSALITRRCLVPSRTARYQVASTLFQRPDNKPFDWHIFSDNRSLSHPLSEKMCQTTAGYIF